MKFLLAPELCITGEPGPSSTTVQLLFVTLPLTTSVHPARLVPLNMEQRLGPYGEPQPAPASGWAAGPVLAAESFLVSLIPVSRSEPAPSSWRLPSIPALLAESDVESPGILPSGGRPGPTRFVALVSELHPAAPKAAKNRKNATGFVTARSRDGRSPSDRMRVSGPSVGRTVWLGRGARCVSLLMLIAEDRLMAARCPNPPGTAHAIAIGDVRRARHRVGHGRVGPPGSSGGSAHGASEHAALINGAGVRCGAKSLRAVQAAVTVTRKTAIQYPDTTGVTSGWGPWPSACNSIASMSALSRSSSCGA